MIKRRLLIIGGMALGLGGAGAILAARFASAQARRIATVRDDYLAGRVVMRATWIMSETEAADIPADVVTPPAAPASGGAESDEAG